MYKSKGFIRFNLSYEGEMSFYNVFLNWKNILHRHNGCNIPFLVLVVPSNIYVHTYCQSNCNNPVNRNSYGG